MTPEEQIVAELAKAVCQRITRQTRIVLQKMTDCRLSGAGTPLKNIWEEICVQRQSQESIFWSAYEKRSAPLFKATLPHFHFTKQTDMSKNLPDSAASVAGDVVEKLRRSRKRLLDLTLRNRLLNFRPGNPNYQDDQKAHKHLVLDGQIEFLWQCLVGQEKQIEVVCLTNDQREHISPH